MGRYGFHKTFNGLTGVYKQAVGIHSGEKGAIRLITKKTKHHNRPAANMNTATYGGNNSGPK